MTIDRANSKLIALLAIFVFTMMITVPERCAADWSSEAAHSQTRSLTTGEVVTVIVVAVLMVIIASSASVSHESHYRSDSHEMPFSAPYFESASQQLPLAPSVSPFTPEPEQATLRITIGFGL
jgi:hypothetical protein